MLRIGVVCCAACAVLNSIAGRDEPLPHAGNRICERWKRPGNQRASAVCTPQPAPRNPPVNGTCRWRTRPVGLGPMVAAQLTIRDR